MTSNSMDTIKVGWARWRAHWRANWRSHLTTALMFVLALTAVQAWRTRDVPEGLAPDFVADAVVGPFNRSQSPDQPVQAGLTGATVSLAQWRAQHPGRAVAVHIWSDWCPYCKLEESAVTRVAADWPVLTVASRSGGAAKVAQVMTQQRLPWVAAVDADGTVAQTYGLAVVPAWVVIDPAGNVSSVTTGYTTEWGMRARLWWAQAH